MNKIQVLSLLLSVLATVGVVASHASIRSRVERAVDEREQALLTRFKPYFVKLYESTQVASYKTDPQSIEDLLEPSVRLLTGVGSRP